MDPSIPQKHDGREPECLVCQEPFRTPKMLPCGHSFCLDPCLRQLANDKDNVRCPECRREHPLPGGKTEGFPTNVSIVRLIKRDMSAPETPIRHCPVCDTEGGLVKCSHCTLLICVKCRIDHSEELKAALLESLKDQRRDSTALQIAAIEEEAKTRLQKEIDDLTAEVKSAATAAKATTDERENEILNQIKLQKESQELGIASRLLLLKDKIEEVVEFCDTNISGIVAANEKANQRILVAIKENSEEQMQQLRAMKDDVLDTTKHVIDVRVSRPNKRNKSIMDFEKAWTEPRTRSDDDSTGIDDEEEITDGAEQSLPYRDCNTVKRCIGREGSKAGQFKDASCLAVCPLTGNIVVCDSGNGRVQVFSENGDHLVSVYKPTDGNKRAKFSELVDVAVDRAGHIIFLDSPKSIYVYTPGGELCESFEIHCDAERFALDSKCLIHLCCGRKGVCVYDRKGTFVNRYVASVSIPFVARHIAITTDDTSYVTDATHSTSLHSPHNYYVFNNEQQLISWGAKKLDQVLNATHAALRCESCWQNMTKAASNPYHQMIIIEDKYICIAACRTHRVHVYDMDWKELKVIGNTGHCRGQLYEPTGVAVTRKGELVVISSNNMLQFFDRSWQAK